MDILKIKQLCAEGKLLFTKHTLDRMLQRQITDTEIVEALANGKIIEEYPLDYPHPSCLVLGLTVKRRYLHVVVDLTDTQLWIITVYEPNPDEWNADFTIRKD